jgi:hypothetical protein
MVIYCGGEEPTTPPPLSAPPIGNRGFGFTTVLAGSLRDELGGRFDDMAC